MPNFTDRWQTPTPLHSESSDLDAQLEALALSLDDAAVDLGQGTLANLPLAGISGRYYYVTDYGILLRDTGMTWLPTSGVAMSATLPVNPPDGTEYDYVADATNGVIWRLKYRSDSPSIYKWEYIGNGASLYAEANNSVSYSGTGYQQLSGGPSITVPKAGEYDIEFGCWHATSSPGGGGLQIMSPRVSDADTPAVLDDRSIYADALATFNPIGYIQVDVRGHGSRSIRVVVPTAPYAVDAMHRSATGQNTHYDERWMKITPVRIL